MMHLKKLLLLLFLLPVVVSGQDIHFSQYMASPVHVNPALIGLFDGEYRLNGHFKSQWGSINNSYKTISLSGDMVAFNGFSNNDLVGLGVSLYSDRAGDTKYTTTNASFSFAYHKALSYYANNYLTVGFIAGVTQKKFSFTDMTFDNQYNGVDYDPTLPVMENIMLDNLSYGDYGFGVNWFYGPDDEKSFYVGSAMYHVNEPNQSFFAGNHEPVFRRHTIYTGGKYAFSDKVAVLPNVMFMLQGPHREVFLGSHISYRLNHVTERRKTSLMLGAFYRYEDAVILVTRFDINNLHLGFSYDINVSGLSVATTGMGGPELSIEYIIDYGPAANRRNLKARPQRCPEF